MKVFFTVGSSPLYHSKKLSAFLILRKNDRKMKGKSIISSLIMGVFFKFGTSPLYQSQVLFLSFNFMCISSQKIFGKCKTKGVKGQGVKYDPPKGVKISKWSKLNSDCRFGFLSKKQHKKVVFFFCIYHSKWVKIGVKGQKQPRSDLSRGQKSKLGKTQF